MSDLRSGVPGVSIERRLVLTRSLASAALCWLGGRGVLAAAAEGESRLEWPAFIERITSTAREIIARGQGESDEYVLALAALAVRATGVPDTRLYAFGKLEPKVSFAPSHAGTPVTIIQWRMEPHAVLPPHCHPGGSVCTLGLEGEARLRNFEIAGPAPSFASGDRRPFLVRQTHEEVMGPGRINTLTPSRDNIHTFTAGPAGARGIDLTTVHGNDQGFSFLAIEPEAKDEGQRLHEAVWTGQNP